MLQHFNYIKNLTILSFAKFFSSWKGGEFVVKLVAATVIRQHMLFFTMSYF